MKVFPLFSPSPYTSFSPFETHSLVVAAVPAAVAAAAVSIFPLFLSSNVTRLGSFSNANTTYSPFGNISQVDILLDDVWTAIDLPAIEQFNVKLEYYFKNAKFT